MSTPNPPRSGARLDGRRSLALLANLLTSIPGGFRHRRPAARGFPDFLWTARRLNFDPRHERTPQPYACLRLFCGDPLPAKIRQEIRSISSVNRAAPMVKNKALLGARSFDNPLTNETSLTLGCYEGSSARGVWSSTISEYLVLPYRAAHLLYEVPLAFTTGSPVSILSVCF